MRRLAPVLFAALFACPPPAKMDAGMPVEDSGVPDAGHDAGRPVRDAGFDAGWENVPEAQWCRSQALARCWRDLRCGRIDETLIEDCAYRASLGCDTALYLASAAAGRHTYDPARAADCLDAYDHGSCEDRPAACAGVFTGRTPPDAGVLVPEDCDPDAGFYYLYENTCPHHCYPWAGAGQSCYDSQGRFPPSCQPGVHGCEYSDAGNDEVCQAPHLENESCRGPYSCALGLVCTSNKCVKQTAATGEPCGVMNGYPYCSTQDFCRKDPAAPMAPGVCQRRAGLGGVCAGYASCLPSLHCSSSIGTGTCKRRAVLGEPCSGNFTDDCAEGLYCPNSTSRCAALPADGGDCSFEGSYYQCAPGFACSQYPDYICTPRVGDGAPCNGYDEVCLSNDCQYGMLPDANYGYRCVRCSQVADGGL